MGCNTRQWGLSNPWMTAFLNDPSSLATLICFLLASKLVQKRFLDTQSTANP